MEKLIKVLEEIRDHFDEEGWSCVLSDKNTFNQNPDLKTDFDVGFDYKYVKALSIIDIDQLPSIVLLLDQSIYRLYEISWYQNFLQAL